MHSSVDNPAVIHGQDTDLHSDTGGSTIERYSVSRQGPPETGSNCFSATNGRWRPARNVCLPCPAAPPRLHSPVRLDWACLTVWQEDTS